ncbi:hypothetical protein [Aliikangiella coralliicola]|uniref:DUF4915 domain-containing protein n=1 Tax=Aliikangiella coralliicola TaxID=2592383 RepID=A0A545UCZ0_9GAMM|nr:hypothetical protein [Aliikangiella coralliicola]TQV87328.1 hypothetical protein FLL46_12830 [Aliikangiella coralliicola]
MKNIINARSFQVPHQYSSGCWGGLTSIGNRVFFGLCTHKLTEHAKLCMYDHSTGEIKELEEFQALLGDHQEAIGHGKIHTQFLVVGDVAYFGTHIGYYKKELHGVRAYEGGRLFGINLKTLALTDFGVMFPGEGITSLSLDQSRNRLYALTWPNAQLVCYEIDSGEKTHLGGFRRGDKGDTVCRSPGIVDEHLIFCTGDGVIQTYHLENGKFSQLSQEIPRVILEEGLENNWQLPAEIEQGLSLDDYCSMLKQNPEWGNLWQPSIHEPGAPSLLAITNTSSCLIRIWPRDDKVELVTQFCLPELLGRYDIGTSTSLTLTCRDEHELFHIGTELQGDESCPKVRKRLLKYDLRSNESSDLGYMVTDQGLDIIYLQTLCVLPDGKLAGVGLVDLPKDEYEAFFATNPAKVDVGISAEDNPYKMQFFVLNVD